MCDAMTLRLRSITTVGDDRLEVAFGDNADKIFSVRCRIEPYGEILTVVADSALLEHESIPAQAVHGAVLAFHRALKAQERWYQARDENAQ
jgi:hypothetical protein